MASLQKNRWVWGFTLMIGASHHCPFQIQALSQSQLLHHLTQISWAPTVCQDLWHSLGLHCGQKSTVPALKRASESRWVVSDSSQAHGYTVLGVLQARMLEWVAIPFSRGSSLARDWTLVSHIAGGFFTNWAMRKAWCIPNLGEIGRVGFSFQFSP